MPPDSEPKPARGRPKGSTRYGEATVTKRIPASAVADIEQFLLQRAQRRIHAAVARSGRDVEVLSPIAEPQPIRCPLFTSRVAAGFPSPADDYIEDWLDLNSLLISDKPATFFVRVKGESMIEEGIRPGDLLVVDKGMEPQSGDIVIAVIDNELTVKELEIAANGRIRLLPANRELSPIELHDGQQLLVWGVVTATVHQFTRGRKLRASARA